MCRFHRKLDGGDNRTRVARAGFCYALSSRYVQQGGRPSLVRRPCGEFKYRLDSSPASLPANAKSRFDKEE
jgi:hypothetical protein